MSYAKRTLRTSPEKIGREEKMPIGGFLEFWIDGGRYYFCLPTILTSGKVANHVLAQDGAKKFHSLFP